MTDEIINDDINICSICLETLNNNSNDINNNIILLSCKHELHKKCYDILIENKHVKCPLCRRYLFIGTTILFKQFRINLIFDRTIQLINIIALFVLFIHCVHTMIFNALYGNFTYYMFSILCVFLIILCIFYKNYLRNINGI